MKATILTLIFAFIVSLASAKVSDHKTHPYLRERFKSFRKETKKDLKKVFNEVEKLIMEKDSTATDLEKLASKITDIDENLNDKITDIDEDFNKEITDIDQNLRNKITDINGNLSNKISNVDVDLSNRITDLDENLSNRITDTDGNLTNKITDVNKNLTNKITDFNENLTKKITDIDGNLTNKINAIDQSMNYEIISLNNSIQTVHGEINTIRDEAIFTWNWSTWSECMFDGSDQESRERTGTSCYGTHCLGSKTEVEPCYNKSKH